LAIPEKDPFLNAWYGYTQRRFPPFSPFGTFTTKLLIAKNSMAITVKKLAQNPCPGQPKMPFYGS
jgi:hypothetical protein